MRQESEGSSASTEAVRDGVAGLDSLEAIERAFMGIFDRLEKNTPEVRGLVLWALFSRWCMGCGLPIAECMETDDRCCDVDDVEVTARMCPKCEMIRWDTVSRKDGIPMRDRTSIDSEVEVNLPAPKETT